MSPLLILGLALLVIVAVLSLLQRRTQVDHTTRPTPPPPPEAPPVTHEGAGPRRVRNMLQIEDPDLGVLAFNDDRLWEGDSVDFDGVPILAELQGDANGPHPVARQLAVAARGQAKALWARGRDLIVAELSRRGVSSEDVEPYEVAVDIEDGRPVAFLWYEADAFDGTIGVSSRDGWKTLTLEVIE